MGRTYPLIFAAAGMAVASIAAKAALDRGASTGDLLGEIAVPPIGWHRTAA